MKADDSEDVFVVIVGDEDDLQTNDRRKQVLNIRQKYPDQILGVEHLIETAEKFGLPLNIIKEEPEEYLDDEEYNNEEEYKNDEEAEHADVEDDVDYETSEDSTLDDKTRQRISWRRQMLSPSERRSFVKELCDEHPELKEDSELLIETLAYLMSKIKRPEPPKDFFIMNDIMFECVVCGAKTKTIPAATRHWNEKHGPRYLVCFACGVDFRSTTNLYKHEKRCTAPDVLPVLKARACTLGRKGRGRPFLKSHSVLRHKPPKQRFCCSRCPAEFACKQSLISHELKHSGRRPFRCEHCPAAYTSANVLLKHSVMHSGVRFICDECGRSFRTKASLIVHLDTHAPQRRFECTECGKRYAQKMALQQHTRRVHWRLPPEHGCQLCDKRFPRMSLLKTHMLKEHGMNIITRKMFYKSLPLLSNTQVERAKVVLKSELGADDSAYIIKEKSPTPSPRKHVQYILPDEEEPHSDCHEQLQDINIDDTSLSVFKKEAILCEASGLVIEYRFQTAHSTEESILSDEIEPHSNCLEQLQDRETDDTSLSTVLKKEDILCEASGMVIDYRAQTAYSTEESMLPDEIEPLSNCHEQLQDRKTDDTSLSTVLKKEAIICEASGTVIEYRAQTAHSTEESVLPDEIEPHSNCHERS